MFSKSNLSKYFYIISVVFLVLFCFFIVQMVVVFFIRAGLESGILSDALLESTAIQFGLSVLIYVLTLCLILGIFQILQGPIKNFKTLLGAKRAPKLLDLCYSLAGYGAYFGLSLIALATVAIFVPGFNAQEKQSVGFEQVSSQIEYAMAFIVLVVLAPVIEEAIFRGFLFTKIRQKISFWPTAIIVSLVFGLVHLQWNVGIDVFMLSLVACFLRENTKVIWAGIGVHMLKNFLAFAILFLHIA